MRRGLTGLNVASLSAMLFLYGPIFILVLYSFNAAHLSMAWGGATLKWYAALTHDEALFAATANSLLIAVISTMGATALGGLIALGMERMPYRRQEMIEGGLILPLVIPEVMMGVALMLFFVMLKMPLGLSTVILGHIVFNIPLVTIMLRTRLRKLDPALGEAAADLGASFLAGVSLYHAAVVTAGHLGSRPRGVHRVARRFSRDLFYIRSRGDDLAAQSLFDDQVRCHARDQCALSAVAGDLHGLCRAGSASATPRGLSVPTCAMHGPVRFSVCSVSLGCCRHAGRRSPVTARSLARSCTISPGPIMSGPKSSRNSSGESR